MLGHMSFVQRERQRLSELLLALGPDAPTLCEGWLTRDMAVHLYLRENKPLAAAGMFLPVAHRHLQREERRLGANDYAAVVADWAAGPPSFLAPMNALMNTAEHFIHHEDVRRANGHVQPRDLSKAVDLQLLKYAKQFASLALRACRVPIVLTPEYLPPVVVGQRKKVAEQGDDIVRVLGAPGELLLWASGRQQCEVQLEGNVEVLRGYQLGF